MNTKPSIHVPEDDRHPKQLRLGRWILTALAKFVSLPRAAAWRRRAWASYLHAAICLTLLFASSAVFAQTRTVRVGVYQNEPKIFMDKNGRASGILIELLNQIGAQEGWNLVYVPCDWAACLQALEDGQIDLMPDVAYSTDRAAKYDFHRTPVLESWSRVYAASAAPINKISDLDGKRIAVLKGSIQQTVFQQLMDGFGYKVTLVPVDTYDQAFTLAANGSADGAIANNLFGDYFYQNYKLQKTTFDFEPVDLYYATAKGRNHDLLDAIDRDLGKWLSNSSSPYYTTLGHWTATQPAYVVPQYVFGVIGGTLGLLLIAVGVIALLRRQVNIRTRHLQQAGAELEKSEQHFQTLARISPAGIFRTDADGATTYVNPTWCAIAGLSPEQALGDGWLKAVHPDDRERLGRGWQESTELHKASFSDYRFLRPDGTMAWVMGQAVPEMNPENQLIGYVGTITDITERVRAETGLRGLNVELEERVAQRTEELNAAMRRALEADQLKSAFLATMSHELRTPLNSIIGFTGVILQGLAGPVSPEQEKQLGFVQNSARHLLELINDVLDISKIEAGQLQLAQEPVDVRQAVEAAAQLVEPLAQKKNLPLQVRLAPEVGLVIGDRRRLEQVIINLANNAIKFTEQGEVEISGWVAADQMIISVRDTGIGIQPAEMEKLFKPFSQVDTGLTRQYEGTGLGLSISKRLVEMMGGTLHVESRAGQGSTFSVSLPRPTGDTR